MSYNIIFSPIVYLSSFARCHLTPDGGTLDGTVTKQFASPVFGTTKSMPPNSTAISKPKDPIARKVRLTKRRASKTMSPTSSRVGVASPRDAPTWLEGEKDCHVPNTPCQSFLQRHLAEDLPLKPHAASMASSSFMYERTVAPSNQILPPITPLLGAVSLEPRSNRANSPAKATSDPHLPTLRATKSLPATYASRVEDLSLSTGNSTQLHRRESYVRSRYITAIYNHNWKP